MRFAALSDDARQRAIRWARETDYFDFALDAELEAEIDQWTELLENIGYDDPKIFYRLNYSQGDYCRFEAKITNPAKYIEFRKELRSKYRKLLNALPDSDIDINITTEVNVEYQHWNYRRTRRNLLRRNELHHMARDFEGYIVWEHNEISEKIKRDLQSCIEYWWKDENIADALSETDIEFDWEGRPI